MAAGTGGANRPAGSATEIGTVTDGHSVGTQKLIRESHMDGQGLPTRLQAPFRALVTGEALESRVERKCAVEKGCGLGLDQKGILCLGALPGSSWAHPPVANATTHLASRHCSSELVSGPGTNSSP